MNLLTIFGTALLGLLGGSGLSLILIKLNELLTHSGTRSPNGFDLLLIFSFPLFAVLGLVYGYKLGKEVGLSEHGLMGLLQTPYLYYFSGLALLAIAGILLWRVG